MSVNLSGARKRNFRPRRALAIRKIGATQYDAQSRGFPVPHAQDLARMRGQIKQDIMQPRRRCRVLGMARMVPFAHGNRDDLYNSMQPTQPARLKVCEKQIHGKMFGT